MSDGGEELQDGHSLGDLGAVGGAVGERVAVTNDESFKHLDDDEEDDYESLCCKLDELLDQDPVACDIQVSWIQP